MDVGALSQDNNVKGAQFWRCVVADCVEVVPQLEYLGFPVELYILHLAVDSGACRWGGGGVCLFRDDEILLFSCLVLCGFLSVFRGGGVGADAMYKWVWESVPVSGLLFVW